MVNPGNHEATCAESDGPNNELSAYLVNGEINGTLPNSTLSYYSCPPSQRSVQTSTLMVVELTSRPPY